MAAGTTPTRRATALFAAGSAIGAVICAFIAYRVAFSFFATYDDEGYFLVSLQEWLDRGQLYDGVYSEYGPAYFTFVGGLFGTLGLDLDLDTARVVTMLAWTLTSVLAGVALLRLTGNPAVALGGQLLAFLALFIVRQDPMYPGSWLALLLVAVLAAASFVGSARAAPALFAVGALVGTAALVKVNVGGFAAVAVAVALALTARPGGRGAWLQAGAGGLVVLVPFVVMASELGREEVARYAIVVALVIAAVVVAAQTPGASAVGRDGLLWLVAGIAAAAAVALGVVIARGTGVGGLIEGMIVQPLQHKDVINGRLTLPSSAYAWAAAGLVAAGVLRRLKPPSGDAALVAGAAARIAAGVLTWVMVAKMSTGDVGAFAPAAAFAWVAAMSPRKDAGPRESFVRLLVPLMAVLNLLQAYPVASNQFRLSALLLVIAGGVAVGDGLWQLARRYGARGALANAAVAAFALWAVFGPAGDQFGPAVRTYDDATRIDLPGATKVRTDTMDPQILRDVAAALERCSSFYGLPGMNSFYVWTGIEPPTGMNVGNWMFQFEAAQQREVRDELAAVPGLCILRNQSLVDLWANGRPVPRRPLLTWIERRFSPAADLGGGYELLVRR